jgi:hypothetical protein
MRSAVTFSATRPGVAGSGAGSAGPRCRAHIVATVYRMAMIHRHNRLHHGASAVQGSAPTWKVRTTGDQAGLRRGATRQALLIPH